MLKNIIDFTVESGSSLPENSILGRVSEGSGQAENISMDQLKEKLGIISIEDVGTFLKNDIISDVYFKTNFEDIKYKGIL